MLTLPKQFISFMLGVHPDLNISQVGFNRWLALIIRHSNHRLWDNLAVIYIRFQAGVDIIKSSYNLLVRCDLADVFNLLFDQVEVRSGD